MPSNKSRCRLFIRRNWSGKASELLPLASCTQIRGRVAGDEPAGWRWVRGGMLATWTGPDDGEDVLGRSSSSIVASRSPDIGTTPGWLRAGGGWLDCGAG